MVGSSFQTYWKPKAEKTAKQLEDYNKKQAANQRRRRAALKAAKEAQAAEGNILRKKNKDNKLIQMQIDQCFTPSCNFSL